MPGDVDVFAFNANQGERVVMHVPDTFAEVTFWDSFGRPSPPQESLLGLPTYTVPSQGIHYVSLKGFHRHRYHWHLEDLVEEVDIPGPGALDLNLDAAVSGWIHVTGDRDLYSIQANAGDGFYWNPSISGVATFMRVLNEDGTEISTVYQNQRGYGWTAPQSGTYYLEISHRSQLGEYEFVLNSAPDDYPDTVGPEVPVIPFEQWTNSQQEVIGDVDVVAFDGLANHYYHVTTMNWQPGDSYWLKSLDDEVIPPLSDRVWKLPTDGRYYLFSRPNRLGEEIEFRVSDRGLDDHPDDESPTAQLVQANTTMAGTFEIWNEVDVFQANLPADVVMNFTSSAEVEATPILRKPGETFDLRSSDFGSTSFDIEEAGSYFLGVIARSGPGDYSFSFDVEPKGANDPPPISLGQAIQSSVADGTKKFSWNATAGERVVLDFEGNWGPNLFIDPISVPVSHDWSAPESKRYLITVEEGSTFAATEFELRIESPLPDDHPDSPPADPRDTLPGSGRLGIGDIDVFQMSLDDLYYHKINLQASEPLDLRLLDTSGNLVRTIHSGAKWTVSSGTYYLEVSGSIQQPVDYSFSFERGSPARPLPRENAPQIAPGNFANGRVEGSADADHFAFNAVPGTSYQPLLPAGSDNIQMRIVDARGIQVSNGSFPWTAEDSGRYYLEITTPIDDIVSYNLQWLEYTDDHSEFVGSNPRLKSWQDVKIDFRFDIDVFRLAAAAGSTYRISNSAGLPGGLIDAPELRVLDEDQDVLASSYRGQVTWTAPSTGDYYLEVVGTEPGTYTIGVDRISSAIDDFNDDGKFTSADVDALFAEIRSATTDLKFDVNEDNRVDQQDVDDLLARNGNLRGDLDVNGAVDFADFLTLSRFFGAATAGYAQGDADGDQVVGFSDFLLVSRNFGM